MFLIITPNGCDANNKCVGVWEVDNGAVANITSFIALPAAVTLLGLGQLDLFFRIAFQTLPSGTTSNYFRFGLVDTGVAWTNAAYIEMAVSSGAPSWWLNCTKASAGASSTAVTTPAIAAYSSSSLTFYKLQLTVNAAATSVTAYANGNLIGTVTSDIPTANLIPIFFIGNQGSATANYFLIDRFYYRYQVVV